MIGTAFFALSEALRLPFVYPFIISQLKYFFGFNSFLWSSFFLRKTISLNRLLRIWRRGSVSFMVAIGIGLGIGITGSRFIGPVL